MKKAPADAFFSNQANQGGQHRFEVPWVSPLLETAATIDSK